MSDTTVTGTPDTTLPPTAPVKPAKAPKAAKAPATKATAPAKAPAKAKATPVKAKAAPATAKPAKGAAPAPAKAKAAKPDKASKANAEMPETARIKVLPEGEENPRRKGADPWQRYETLLKSKTVGDFLKVHPKWITTLTRAKKEGRIEIKV